MSNVQESNQSQAAEQDRGVPYFSNRKTFWISADWPDSNIFAKYRGKIIGKFELLEFELYEGGSELIASHIYVKEKYRRYGIASEMVNMAVAAHDKFFLDSYVNYTPDELVLFLHCHEEGIITEDFLRSYVVLTQFRQRCTIKRNEAQ